MMNNTISRIVLATILMLVFFAATSVVEAWLESQKIVLPEWKARDFPKTLGAWEGTDQEQDLSMYAAAGAADSVERSYRNPSRNSGFSLYLALYTNPGEGLSHMPPVCYAGNGFEREGKAGTLYLRDKEDNEFPIHISKWINQDGEPVFMAYYYQWGDHFLFDRSDLGFTRLKMSGMQIQPAMIKVLLEIGIEDPDKDKIELQKIAQAIYDWTNGVDRTTKADEATP